MTSPLAPLASNDLLSRPAWNAQLFVATLMSARARTFQSTAKPASLAARDSPTRKSKHMHGFQKAKRDNV